jgi:3-dehydroquinate synthase
MGQIRIDTPSRSYAVHVGAGLLADLGSLARAANVAPGRVHMIVDAGVPGEVVARAADALAGVGWRLSRSNVVPSEADKSLQTVHRLLQEVAGAGLERSDVIVAVGGGIVSDMAGFVASAYRRGVSWVCVPTTLLSMVDASVGGKTGVNLRVGGQLYKNMAGAFWQPALVIADTETLTSLDEREFRSGLAECIKHAMLGAHAGDAGLMAFTRAGLADVLDRRPGPLGELVERNIRVKAAIVGDDERELAPSEAGGRALLNLGHTFGHAIETIDADASKAPSGFWPVTHGEAVALGTLCATRLGELLKTVGEGTFDQVRALVGHAGLPTTAPGLPGPEAVLERMAHDKKAQGGKLRLIVPSGPGLCRVVVDPPREVVLRAIEVVRP